jgi:ABC-type sugar transport system substrate-binding protein
LQLEIRGGEKLFKRLQLPVITILLLVMLAGCGGKTQQAAGDKKAGHEGAVPAYKIAVVTPTLSTSEDEFRGAQRVVKKYPGMIKHITLPDNFAAEQETAISQITSLANDKEVQGIVICAGYSGILPAIQKVKEKRPDMKVITAPIWDDPDMMAKYVDLSLDTDWIGRGVTIPTKAQKMGANTFIHYSFPTHLAKEQIVKRRDNMKKTCEQLGMRFVEVVTPDPQTGNGPSAMLQFLQEDIPRQIAKYGKDTCIFGTNCPMQDVIIAKSLELGFIMAEQCCPTPTQGFPAAMGLEIKPEDAGDFTKINQMIKEKAAQANQTGRLSTWPVPVGVFLPEFSVEIARGMIEGKFTKPTLEEIKPIAKEVAGVEVTFNKMKEGLDNYWLIIEDSIIY